MKHIVLSDIHANHLALQAVLETVQKNYSPKETQYVFLGDLLGYGPLEGALACVEWFNQQQGWAAVPGNHDEWIACPLGKISKVSNGARVSLLAQRAYLEHNGLAGAYFDNVCKFIEQPTDRQIIQKQMGNSRLLFTHGDFSKVGLRLTYLYPWNRSQQELAIKGMRTVFSKGRLLLFCGHTHFPMFAGLASSGLKYQSIEYGVPQPVGNCALINGGSVGQPRDGDPRASFVVYDDREHTVTFLRVEYPVEKLVRLLRADGNYASSRHKLTPSARENIIQRVGGYENVEKAYQSLIQRIQSGDGASELSEYRRVYQQTERGLQAIST